MTGQSLTDTYGRTFNYARIAVTERCNLRCVYCMPEEGVDFARGERLLSTDELRRLITILARLGVQRVRFTGGEPLVRKDLLSLVQAAALTEGIEQIHLTSNGVLLERHLSALVEAGLTGVNISLDSLRADRFEQMTRRTGLETVLSSIHAASAALSSVKVNVVAMRGFNDDELVDFARMTMSLPVTVRFIELMPFDASQVWKTGRFLRAQTIRDTLVAEWPEMEAVDGSATETWVSRLPGGAGRVAIIPAFTRSLCSACNRIRITADGKLRNCLYSESEFSLRELLRAGAPDEEIVAVLRRGVHAKLEDGWAAQRETTSRFRISMTQIGG